MFFELVHYVTQNKPGNVITMTGLLHRLFSLLISLILKFVSPDQQLFVTRVWSPTALMPNIIFKMMH